MSSPLILLLGSLWSLSCLQSALSCCIDVCGKACSQSVCERTLPECQFGAAGSNGNRVYRQCQWSINYFPIDSDRAGIAEHCRNEEITPDRNGMCICTNVDNFSLGFAVLYYTTPFILILVSLCMFCYCNKRMARNRMQAFRNLDFDALANPARHVPFVLQVEGTPIPAADLALFEKTLNTFGPARSAGNSFLDRSARFLQSASSSFVERANTGLSDRDSSIHRRSQLDQPLDSSSVAGSR